jgi:hypothetical protein
MTLKTCKTCSVEYEYNPKRRFASCPDCVNKKRREKKLEKDPYRAKNIEFAKEGKKLCKYCDIAKEFASFRNNRLKCIDCERKDGRKYRKDGIGKEKMDQWYKNNPGYSRKTYTYLTKLEERKQIVAENKAKRIAKEEEHVRIRKENYKKKKELSYANDLTLYKMVHNYRTRLRNAINKNKTSSKYVDCSWKFLHKYINYYLEEFPDFNLDNYGPDWHIDHVIPLARLDLADENNRWVMKWFNLAPLSKEDNITKNDNIWVSQLKHHKQVLQKFIEKEKIVNNDINNLFEYMATYLNNRETPKDLTTTLF